MNFQISGSEIIILAGFITITIVLVIIYKIIKKSKK